MKKTTNTNLNEYRFYMTTVDYICCCIIGVVGYYHTCKYIGNFIKRVSAKFKHEKNRMKDMKDSEKVNQTTEEWLDELRKNRK